MTQILIQLAGFLAIGFALSVYQFNRRVVMLSLDMTAATLWMVHFALLGAWTGTAMNTIGAVRNLTFQSSSRHPAIPAVFIGLFTVATGFTWWLGDGPLSVLPLLGMIAGTIGYWNPRPLWVRLAALISAPLWLTYNAIRGSLPGVIIEVVLIMSSLIGIYRFDVRGRPEPAKVVAA